MKESAMSVSSLVGAIDDIARCSSVLAEGIEGEFIKFVAQQEECRKKWLGAENEAIRLKQDIAKITAENEALEVKLKHARSQVEIEIKKRMKAEAAQDHMERQVALIRELLSDKDTMSRLNDNERQTLIQISQCHPDDRSSPRKRRSAVHDESTCSILSPSDVSCDTTGDDLDYSYPRRRSGRKPPAVAPDGDVSPPKRPRNNEDTGVVRAPVIPDSPVRVPELPVSQISVQPSAPELNYRDPYRHAIRELEEYTSPRKETPQIQRIASQDRIGQARRDKKHAFCSKTVIKPETCQVCNRRIKFGKLALKCKDCRAVCHPDCKDHLPLPCVPTKDTPGSAGKRARDENIEFYAPTTSPMVPEIVVKCIDEVERRGLSEVGIYRVPGAERSVRELKEKFLLGKIPDLRQVSDIHVVCGLLKDFLRNLAEPLLTYELWSKFVDAANKTDEDDSASATYQAVSELPQANRDTLAFLVVHLQKVSHCTECKMSASNLAKVYGPTIVGNSSTNLEPMQLLQEAKWQPKVVERLLSMPLDYWNQFISNDEENLRSPPFNPATHLKDGTPITPECTPVPASMLGPLTSGSHTVKKKGSFLSRTPLTPRFGSKSKHPSKRPTHFFASPMLK
ncbi:rac GTPase-activating protein 1-like isoform X2 [Acropora muricata]|uniref:rac GTPase-activating protein 1-like n=1 Tax=Acropora millepora TaxID=45264 RepID=UPI001CF38BFE|nr:rac GTPase-activating protein 1-like [Acropora millepora]